MADTDLNVSGIDGYGKDFLDRRKSQKREESEEAEEKKKAPADAKKRRRTRSSPETGESQIDFLA
jgi:hypothetical protein